MASDFKGSATVMISIASHFGHSKVRCSDPSAKGASRTKFIRARHLRQRGRSIEDSGTSGILGMILLSCIARRWARRGAPKMHPENGRAQARYILLDRSPNSFRRLSGTRHSGKIFLLCPVVDVRCGNYRVSRQGTDS